MLVILALCLLQLLHVDACETVKDGVTWTFDASVDEMISGVETFQECKSECLNKENCTAYTLVEGPVNNCFLFLRPSQSLSCPCCKSGIITRIVAGSGCFLDPEQIIQETVVNSAEECLNLCETSQQCTNFLYFNSNSIFRNFCYLYKGCDGITDCEDCQSGQLNCNFIPELPEECSNYMVLDDSTRNNEHGPDYYCDGDTETSPDWQGPGVYRIDYPAGTKMAETSPGYGHCGTLGSGWTRDEHPTSPGQQKNMTACFPWDNDECLYQTDFTATNCGKYFVYKLNNAPDCYFRYCGSF